MATTPPPLHPTPERGLLFRVALAAGGAVLTVAVVAGLVGAELSVLSARAGIERRASLLAVMTSARLPDIPAAQWAPFIQRLTGSGERVVTIVDARGHPIEGAPESPIPERDPLLVPDHARGDTADAAFFVATEPALRDGVPHRVLVAVRVPASRGGIADLLLAFVGVLSVVASLGIASALIVARDVVTDVNAIARRAINMAAGEAAALEPLPIRALDEAGTLIAAFNHLQRRFAEELDAHRLALARLEDAERRKEALIATLRHELRTPLNSIIGFAELLLSGVDGQLNAAQTEDLEVVARSGRNLLQLVDDVLDLSAIASGRFSIEPRPVDVAGLAREVAREASGVARRRHVAIELDGANTAIVDGDPLSLRRAITNLVQNAIEHGGGRVRIDVTTDGRNAAVAVKDNGPGIRPQDLKRLFKPFERGRTGEAGRVGAGLGLAITVALLELHGGALAAESEIGQGSTFIARIPLRRTALEQAGFA